MYWFEPSTLTCTFISTANLVLYQFALLRFFISSPSNHADGKITKSIVNFKNYQSEIRCIVKIFHVKQTLVK